MKLNLIQKQAIKHVIGPCLILAGAGSGKTSVIINKIIELIKICHYHPKTIITVTFTNKAAYEIKNRLKKKLTSFELNTLVISTFHSLGMKIIYQEYHLLHIKKNFTLLNESDQFKILKEIFFFSIKPKKKILKKILFKISYWKQKLLQVKDLKKKKYEKSEQIFIFYYSKYEKYLKLHNMLDFDDLILLPTLLLKNNLTVQLKWRKKIQYILIDEYQDTNISQYELMKTLINVPSNFTIVGDNDQSIYSWRGAQQKIFFLLKKDFPALKTIKMEQNYRSSQCILKAANSLISNNPIFLKKKLFSNLKYGPQIYLFEAESEFEEAKQIINFIYTHKNTYNLKYFEYAILYRNRYQSKVIETELISHNIPYTLNNEQSFFEKLEIKDLLAYLRLVLNSSDDLAFLRIINVPRRRVGINTVLKLKEISLKYNLNLLNTCIFKNLLLFFNYKTVLILNNFFKWIFNLKKILKKTPEKILDIIICDINYLEWTKKRLKDLDLFKIAVNNINFLKNWLLRNLLNTQNKSSSYFSDIIARLVCGENLDDLHQESNKSNTLQLMTLHSSKGLEFSVVCIIGLEEGILPHKKSILLKNIVEERRLLYVGMTRAKMQLFLSFCKKRYFFGEILKMLPSRFLNELPKNDIFWHKKKYINSNFFF
ncbi:UvrD-helicase domain-containing protein [Buchnera aphidicola]|uniref:DNA 3'-5' helicase n=1 Tax=Buchnera aphidicola subsp. Tuberolachnus salignus TaxID=98804 RepID=A0A160SX39_BUCTT|nr:UvrD-helicase domain-containing protein [Buchnera aphidicola]CUR53360.1 ATP-dependent DNA helicase Rep [Buchnera aphidicola (Tuberolachnus salignus)]